MRIFVPFNKIDQERRIVWGIAQSEDPDLQDDLLDYSASVKAFEKWAGNVREMHDDRAIGRSVQIQCDPKTKQIAVGAYISKGAEDAWQKVLDGTYRGYSIGGYPLKTAPIHKNGRRLRHVTEYVLEELSLVDTPANPRCVITAIQKRGAHLVATDVLGHSPTARVARDVLSPKGVSTMRATRSKIPALVAFTKALAKSAPDDEIIVMRKSDIVTANGGDSFVLKGDAHIESFKKSDLDSDGYADDADDTTSDAAPSNPGLAQNAMDLHDDLHNQAGDDTCQCSRDDDAPPMSGPPQADDGGADMDMGKNNRRRDRVRMDKGRTAGGLTKSDVASMLGEFAATIDAKLEKLTTGAGGAAPRKDGLPGALVKRDGDGAAGDANPDPRAQVVERLNKAYEKRTEFLKKGTQGLSVQDRSERNALAQEIAELEVQQLELTGAQAR